MMEPNTDQISAVLMKFEPRAEANRYSIQFIRLCIHRWTVKFKKKLNNNNMWTAIFLNKIVT